MHKFVREPTNKRQMPRYLGAGKPVPVNGTPIQVQGTTTRPGRQKAVRDKGIFPGIRISLNDGAPDSSPTKVWVDEVTKDFWLRVSGFTLHIDPMTVKVIG